MTKIKLLTIAVIGLLLVNIGIIAFLFFKKPSHEPKGRPPMEQDGPKKIIIDRLHFDKEQVAHYDQLIKEHQATIKSLDDSIKNAKNDLYRSLTDENNTAKDSLITNLGLLQRQIELTHYQHFESIKKICKSDQLNNFNELTKELASFFAPGKKDGPPPKD